MELNTEIITTAPLDSASVVLLRDSAQGMQVLLLRRHQASNVLGGAYVFPGGKLDAADQSPGLLAQLSQDIGTLHQRLAEPDLSAERAAGLFVAAIREAFEECRILLGQTGDDSPDLQALQDALASGQSAQAKGGCQFGRIVCLKGHIQGFALFVLVFDLEFGQG